MTIGLGQRSACPTCQQSSFVGLRLRAAARSAPRAPHRAVQAAFPQRTEQTRRIRQMTAKAAGTAIEEETAVDRIEGSLLRQDFDDPEGMRGKFERLIRGAQDSITQAVEAVDGCSFREDAWTRPGGGGGISRVLQGGNVWEKAGVNVSVVYGSMPPEAYRAATGTDMATNGAPDPKDRVPFFAAGISSVMHPRNPHAPTMHFNYRYFETDEWRGIPSQWWFGGGTDITPSYLYPEDMQHFHSTYKEVCDRHDAAFYPKFKAWADDYFLIKHRGERRGLGGIFFDDLNDRDPDQILGFSTDCVNAVTKSYIPLVEKHMNDDFTQEQKDWQQLRRGRYVEFNLVYDRGTTFGLKTGGRIESILMSLPLTCRFEYDHQPQPGSPEADLLDACKNPREWI